MKKNIVLLLSFLFAFIFCLPVFSQTNGSLNFSVKITEPVGGYNNKLVIAIWLEDSATETFIKTKLRYAVTEVQYLNVWIAKSGQNVVDAITGPTNHPGTFNVIWNGTAVDGTLVPDGKYNVWIQFSDKNSSGPTKFCTFLKGPNPVVNATYPNSGNFTDMVLSWTPSSTQINNPVLLNEKILISPNPALDKVNIEFMLRHEQKVDIAVYNLKGQIVKQFAKGTYADAGLNTIVWHLTDNDRPKPGLYFLRLKCKEYEVVKKMNIL